MANNPEKDVENEVMESKVTTYPSPTVEVISKATLETPRQLRNGNCECRHTCKSKTTYDHNLVVGLMNSCKHLCCKEGISPALLHRRPLSKRPTDAIETDRHQKVLRRNQAGLLIATKSPDDAPVIISVSAEKPFNSANLRKFYDAPVIDMSEIPKVRNDFDSCFEDIVSLSSTTSFSLQSQGSQPAPPLPKNASVSQKLKLNQSDIDAKVLFDMLGDCVEFV